MSINRIRQYALLVFTLLSICLVVNACRKENNVRIVKVGLSHSSEHSFTRSLERFADALESKTQGRYQVRIYPSSQIGDEKQMQEMLTLGTAEMTVTGLVNTYEPLFALFEMPYLYRDRAHAERVLNGAIVQEVAQSLIPLGMRLIGFYENGFRHITNTRGPINRPEDLQNMVIRTPENPAQIATFQALGALPTPLSFSELYTALMQGVVHAQENPLQNIKSANLHQVSPHIAKTAHIYNAAYILISERFWLSLSPTDRDIFRACIRESSNWQLAQMEQLDRDLEKQLKSEGAQFTYPDQQDFAQACKPAYEAIYRSFSERETQARELVASIRQTQLTRISYINSYHRGYGSSDEVMRGIEEVLKPAGISLKTFFMDTKQHNSPAHLEKVTTEILTEIEKFKPHCLIASDDNAAKYIIAPHFKQGPLPVVFCGVNNSCGQYGLPTPHVTGMLEVLPVEQSITILKRMDPKIKTLTVLTENTTSARANRELLTPVYEAQGLTTRYVLVDTFEQWQAAFLQANQEADLICLPTNGAIKNWQADQAQKLLQENLRVPVLTHDDFMMPYAVFGLTKVAREQGQWAANTALSILNGQSPADIPVTQNQQTEMYINQTLAERIGFILPADLQDVCRVID